MVLGMVYGIGFLAHYIYITWVSVIWRYHWWLVYSFSISQLSSAGLEQNRPVDREGGAGHMLPDIAW